MQIFTCCHSSLLNSCFLNYRSTVIDRLGYSKTISFSKQSPRHNDEKRRPLSEASSASFLDKVRNDVFCSYLYYSRFPAKTQTFVRFFFHIFTPFSLVLVRIQGAQSRSAAAITTSLSGSMLQQGGIPRGRPVQELIPELNRRVVTIPIHKRRAHCVAARLSIPQRHGAARPAFASFFISNRQNQQKNIKDL